MDRPGKRLLILHGKRSRRGQRGVERMGQADISRDALSTYMKTTLSRRDREQGHLIASYSPPALAGTRWVQRPSTTLPLVAPRPGRREREVHCSIVASRRPNCRRREHGWARLGSWGATGHRHRMYYVVCSVGTGRTGESELEPFARWVEMWCARSRGANEHGDRVSGPLSLSRSAGYTSHVPLGRAGRGSRSLEGTTDDKDRGPLLMQERGLKEHHLHVLCTM